jgi:hypothetical protein
VNEQLLVDFLCCRATAKALGPALLAARVEPDTPNYRTSGNYRVTPLREPVQITAAQIDELVEAVETGELTEEQAGIAVFLMEAQPDRFIWDTDTTDGERVADVLFWLGNPSINYPLTPANLAAFRRYLRTGEPFTGEPSRGAGA